MVYQKGLVNYKQEGLAGQSVNIGLVHYCTWNSGGNLWLQTI